MTDLRHQLPLSRSLASSYEEAFLEMQRSAALMQRDFIRLLRTAAPKGLRWTDTHYNILRILRGADPETLSCGDIGDRLVTPVPDVTRLVDRLCNAGLTHRRRDGADRRVVRVGITEPGLDLLARLDTAVDGWLRQRLGHLSDEQLAALTHLSVAVRRSLEEPRASGPSEFSEPSEGPEPADG